LTIQCARIIFIGNVAWITSNYKTLSFSNGFPDGTATENVVATSSFTLVARPLEDGGQLGGWLSRGQACNWHHQQWLVWPHRSHGDTTMLLDSGSPPSLRDERISGGHGEHPSCDSHAHPFNEFFSWLPTAPDTEPPSTALYNFLTTNLPHPVITFTDFPFSVNSIIS
jgi:hypothetical protein